MSEEQSVREVSRDWHSNISNAEDGSIVQIVLLDAKKDGLLLLGSGKPLGRSRAVLSSYFNWSLTPILRPHPAGRRDAPDVAGPSRVDERADEERVMPSGPKQRTPTP